MIAGVKIENLSCNPDHVPFRGGLSSKSYDLIQSTCTQNLTTVPEISLGSKKLKRVTYVTLTMPVLRMICPPYAET